MKRNVDLKKILLITTVISLVIGALMGIYVFLFDNLKDGEELLMTTLTIIGYSVTGLCCSVLYGKGRFVPLALSGVVISFIGFLFTMLLIWDLFLINASFEIVTVLMVLSASIAHACLLLLIKPNRPLINRLLYLTLIFISFVALMLILLIFPAFEDVDNFYFRILGVYAILDVLGTIVTPILNKIYSIRLQTS